MPTLSRNVLHQRQLSQSDCLPAAVQMVMTYLGYSLPYKTLYDLLGTQSYGTPFRHLKRLAELGAQVSITHLDVTEIAAYLEQDLPIIAGIHTEPLPYWEQAVDHAVVVVGFDAQTVSIHDPSQFSGPQIVPRTAFELAQLDFDNLCAVISK